MVRYKLMNVKNISGNIYANVAFHWKNMFIQI